MDPSSHPYHHRTWLRPKALRDARHFAKDLGDGSVRSNGLMVLGSQNYEPWHFVAHMHEQAELNGRMDLIPRLVRWTVPRGAPDHLSFSVEDMLHAGPRRSLLVIEPAEPTASLLERICDVRRAGTRILTMHRGNGDLTDLSHETLTVDASRPFGVFDLTEHVVTRLAPRSKMEERRLRCA